MHGCEFSLMLSVQQGLAGFHVRQDRVPFLQTISQENHRAKRIWPEINQKINYPLKYLLIQMVVNQIIDMRDETVKFCGSWVTILKCDFIVRVCACSPNRFVRFYHKVNDAPEIWRKEDILQVFHFPISWLFCK